MKPIYVEVSDEITTVIERMRRTNESALILVIPKGAILLQSIVNLKLAKKAALDVGKSLTLITTDKIGRNLATQVGIAVASHLGEDGQPEGNEEPLEGPEPHVISGVKVHRYYEDDDTSPTTETTTTPPEPIIPRQILREKKTTVATKAAAISLPEVPITVREITPEPVPPLKTISSVPEITLQKEPLQTSEENGLQEAEDSAAAVAAATPLPHPIHPPRRFRVIYFLCLVILGLLAVGAFYLPKTAVTISVKPEPWQKQLQLTAKVGAPLSLTNPTAPLPAQLFTGQATAKLDYKATGTQEVGDKASGTAQVFNGYSSTPQPLPAGSTLTVGNLSFTTTQDVVVPGAQVQNFKSVAGSTTVNITASQSGSDSNLSNASATVSGTNLYAQIVSTTGGSSKQVAVVTQADISSARAQLITKLQSASKTKLQDTLKGHDLISLDSADTFNLDSFTSSVPSGTQADTVQVSGSGTTKRLGIDRSVFQKVTKARLAASQDTTHTYFTDSVEPGNLTINTTDQTATLVATAKGRISTPVITAPLFARLAGKNRAAGVALLQQQIKDATITIHQSPSWWPNKNFPYSPKFLTISATYE